VIKRLEFEDLVESIVVEKPQLSVCYASKDETLNGVFGFEEKTKEFRLKYD